MTTIVVDSERGYLAADCMATTNEAGVSIFCPKIRVVPKKHDRYDLMACAGTEGPIEIFEAWYKEGNLDEPLDPISADDEEDFTAVILTATGRIYTADKWMRLSRIHSRYFAAGSGGVYAWAVLEAGCSISKAMEVAIRMDPNTGHGWQIKYLTSGK